MAGVRFRDEPRAGRFIYAERARIAHALRMESDAGCEDIYEPVIEALDLLLEHIANEVDDDQWKDGVRMAQVQLLTAALKDCDRCDLFLDVSKALSDAGLDWVDI